MNILCARMDLKMCGCKTKLAFKRVMTGRKEFEVLTDYLGSPSLDEFG